MVQRETTDVCTHIFLFLGNTRFDPRCEPAHAAHSPTHTRCECVLHFSRFRTSKGDDGRNPHLFVSLRSSRWFLPCMGIQIIWWCTPFQVLKANFNSLHSWKPGTPPLAFLCALRPVAPPCPFRLVALFSISPGTRRASTDVDARGKAIRSWGDVG